MVGPSTLLRLSSEAQNLTMPITQRIKDNQFAVGQRVRIQMGPLGGLDGVVVDNRAPRLVLSVRLIHTTTHVELDQDSIVAVPVGSGKRAVKAV